MIKNFQIDILTTLIPEVKNDQELEKKNPLLKLLKKKNLNSEFLIEIMKFQKIQNIMNFCRKNIKK